MATATFNTPYNMVVNQGFFEVDSVSFTPNLLIVQSPEGMVQYYRGSFVPDASGDWINGTLTDISEQRVDGTPTWTFSHFSIASDVYASFADNNDTVGLTAYILNGSDSIQGSSGSDVLLGFEGNDTVLGGESSDTVQGGNGNDSINGNMGADVVSGEAGNDLTAGGKDNDAVYGGLGDDTVNGNLGIDIVYGNEGNDIVRGGKEADTIYGGDGHDTIYGDLGNDLLSGNAGADIFVFVDNSGADIISDFDSFDRIQIQININNSGIASFTDINSRITVIGNAVSIDLGSSNSVLLNGITALDSTDFVFI